MDDETFIPRINVPESYAILRESLKCCFESKALTFMTIVLQDGNIYRGRFILVK